MRATNPTTASHPTDDTHPNLTPPQVARMLKVDSHKIIQWIDSGELAAVNLAVRKDGSRPRYKISLAALKAFEQARATAPSKPVKALLPKVPQYH